MSAIAGICYFDGRPVDRNDVLRMLARLRHRGSGRAEMWIDDAVGLGWSRPQAGVRERREPRGVSAALRGLVVAADARIDNREELLGALGVAAGLREGLSDSLVILLAYERWGERCPEMLLGDFAFAIRDEWRATLFCARDHFGVKPLYYFRSEGTFAFASEIKALLSLEGVPRRINEMRVAEFLAASLQDTEATFYTDLLRLPPAHRLTVSGGEVRLERYWNLDPTREIHFRTEEEYGEGFREIFTESVRTRLASSTPAGCMLSGGLDSSSIVCVARKIYEEGSGRRLPCFSAVFDGGPEGCDLPYMQAVVEGGGIEPHPIPAENLSPLSHLDRMLAQEDQPFFAPNLFLHWALYEAARQAGVRVLLDGLDGDITVSHGIGMLPELARRGRWIALSREVLGLSRRFGRSALGILRDNVLYPLVPGSALRVADWIRRRSGPESAGTSLLHHDFARRIGWEAVLAAKRRRWPRSLPTARLEHYWGLTQGLIPYLLEVADHAAMGFSIEPRYPFFDKRLTEFCLALPTEQKIFHGWTRMVMRRGMAGILPEKVRWRGGKANLGGGFFKRMLSNGAAALDGMVRNPAAALWEYADREAVRRIYLRAVQSGERDGGLILWQAAVLGCWLQRWNAAPTCASDGAGKQDFENRRSKASPLAATTVGE